jgi:hypothetical protein
MTTSSCWARRRVRRVVPAMLFAGIGACGASIGALAAGARMGTLEQFAWPFLTALFVLICVSLHKLVRELLSLADTQNEVLAEQGELLGRVGYLLRVPPEWERNVD